MLKLTIRRSQSRRYERPLQIAWVAGMVWFVLDQTVWRVLGQRGAGIAIMGLTAGAGLGAWRYGNVRWERASGLAVAVAALAGAVAAAVQVGPFR